MDNDVRKELAHAVWDSLEFHDVCDFVTEEGDLISKCQQCRYGVGHLSQVGGRHA